MSKASPVHVNFTSGEVSPLMAGRIDTVKYQSGVKKLENFLVRTQGGISRRAGTRHISEVRDSSKFTRLIPFEFSDQQAYALEFSDGFVRLFYNGHSVLDEVYTVRPITSITANGSNIKVAWDNLGILYGTDHSNNGSGLIRVTFSAPHQLITGDRLLISAIFTLDPNAIGTWIVTYVSSTQVDLQGSVSSGSFSGVQSWSYPSNLVSGSANNGSGLIRITTYKPHGLATGDKIYMGHSSSGVDFSSTPAIFDWVVTVISRTTFDLQGSTFVGSGTNDDAFVKWPRVGSEVKISGNTGSMAINGTWRIKSVQFYDVVTLANSTFSGTTSGTIVIASKPIEVPTPYADTDLSTLKYCQSADILYLFHGSYPTQKLLRYSANTWKLQEVSFLDGPYLPMRSLAPVFNQVSPEQGFLNLDVSLEVSSYTHTAIVESAVNFTDVTDDDGTRHLEYRKDDDQWRLGKIQSASIAASNLKRCTIDVFDNVLSFVDESVKLQSKEVLAVGSGINSAVTRGANVRKKVDPNNELQTAAAGTAAGTLTSQFSNTFGTPDVGKYVRYHDNTATSATHWAQITGIPRGTAGATAKHAAAVVQAAISTAGTGKFTLVSELRSATVKAFKSQTAFGMFVSTDVGRSIRLGFSGRWTWGKISAFVSSSQVTVTFYEDIPRDPHDANNLAGKGQTYDWKLGAWSATTGYPKACGFHEQRLWAGGSNTEPQTLWGSRSASFEDMGPTQMDSTVLDSDAINYTIVSGKVNPIRWVSSGAVLLVGGLGQEWQVRAASSIQEPITPTNISVIPQTSYGSNETVSPQKIASSTVFANRGSSKLRELSYDYTIDAFTAKDISIISEHIFPGGGGVLYSEYQKDPINLLWYILTDGTLVSVTYERDQEVIAWSRHLLGGSGIVESMCVIPSITGLSDYLYLIVKRTINSVTRRYIEYLDLDFLLAISPSKTNMFFVDSGSTFNLSSRTIFEGLDYLEGKIVQVVADGIQVADATVSSGSITLAVAATTVSVGLQYASKLQTLPTEAGAALGTSQVKRKRVNKVGVRVLNTARFSHASQDSDYQTKTFNEDLSFFTGSEVLVLEQGHNFEGTFWLKQDLAEPFNLLIIAPELRVNEEQ